jgi:hypothetical protein
VWLFWKNEDTGDIGRLEHRVHDELLPECFLLQPPGFIELMVSVRICCFLKEADPFRLRDFGCDDAVPVQKKNIYFSVIGKIFSDRLSFFHGKLRCADF